LRINTIAPGGVPPGASNGLLIFLLHWRSMEFASRCNCAQPACWRPRCQNPIYGKSARSFNENSQPQRDGKQMKFISFTLLITGPIHKEANPAVYNQDGYDHIDNDP